MCMDEESFMAEKAMLNVSNLKNCPEWWTMNVSHRRIFRVGTKKGTQQRAVK